MTAVRTLLTGNDKTLLSHLQQEDNYVWSLSNHTGLPRQTAESSLLKLENAGFLSSYQEKNEHNVMRKNYSIRPHIKELLLFDTIHASAVLERTLRKLKESPEANRDSVFTATKREYELTNGLSFASPRGNPLDLMERLLLDPSTKIGRVLRPVFAPDSKEKS